MDFHSILSVAERKQKIAEKQKSGLKGLNTKFGAPKKEQKPRDVKSETLKKLLAEKEREKKAKERARMQAKKDEEKAKRFRIPKAKPSLSAETTVENSKCVEVTEEEVTIHKEDFVKSSSKKRVAHSAAFKRPLVSLVKTQDKSAQNSSAVSEKDKQHQDARSAKHSKTSSANPASSSSGKSSDKHRSSSKSVSSKSSSHSSEKSLLSSSKLSNSSSKSSVPSSSSKSGAVSVKTHNGHKSTSKDSGQKVKTRPRPGPPPLGIEALLKLAKEKQKEPPKLEPPIISQVKKAEQGPLMTQEEKDRLARTKTKSYQEWLKFGKSNTSPEDLVKKHTRKDSVDTKQNISASTGKSQTVKRKLNSDDTKTNITSKMAKLKNMQANTKAESFLANSKQTLREKIKTKSVAPSTEKMFKNKQEALARYKAGQRAPQPALPRTKSAPRLDHQKMQTPTNNKHTRPKPASAGRKEESPSYQYSSTNENILVCGPAKKEEPPKPQNPWDRIYGQIQKNRPLPAKRHIDDDKELEEEDWSEEDDDFIDDDFIDDGPVGEDNYSEHLKDVFGYSYRDRFRNFNDNDIVESSFAQQMKEEARSTRLGKLEDLEDMKMEAEELRRKKLKKKMKR